MKKIKEALLFLIVQFSMYFFITLNQRGIVEFNYGLVIFTDVIVASMGFFIIKRIANSAEALHQLAGYVTGGVLGSVLAMYLNQKGLI
jgi:hypothetical protein